MIHGIARRGLRCNDPLKHYSVLIVRIRVFRAKVTRLCGIRKEKPDSVETKRRNGKMMPARMITRLQPSVPSSTCRVELLFSDKIITFVRHTCEP